MKKVIFLDLDGVLNSRIYDRLRDRDKRTYIDETRLPVLKRVTDETNAVIVFSSTWKKHWDKDQRKCDEEGVYINDCFAKYGLKITDKTPISKTGDRCEEISAYLANEGDVENYVIIDDENFGRSESIRSHTVKTNAFFGRGLEEEHAEKAIEILNGGI